MRKTSAKKQIAFLTFFLINVFTLHSQNNNFLNVNVIISDSTEKALKDVAIYNSQQKIIGLTDNYGTTTISVRYGDVIMLSHISYEQKRLKISKESVVKDEDGKNYMFAILREKAYLLSEAQVIENAPHLAYKNKEVWIVDYVVGDEGITAITTTGRKSFLLHLGFEQDTLSIKQIDKKFESLFRDVFGNIHLLGPDSTYQVYSDKGKMQLLYGVTLEKHNTTFKPIAAITDSILITQKYGLMYQEIFYYKLHRRTKEFGLLADLIGQAYESAKSFLIDAKRDAIIDRVMAENPMFVGPDNVRIENNLSFLEQDKDVLPNASTNEEGIKNDTILKHFYYSAYFTFTPIYCPIKFVNDTIYVFDFENDKLMRFGEDGTFVSESEMTFHRTTYFKNIKINNPWDKNIIVDKANNKCYAQFSTDGIVTLKEINLDNGTIRREIRLSDHYFPTNIQIHNSFVYYKFIDVRQISGSDCRSLYKMKIE